MSSKLAYMAIKGKQADEILATLSLKEQSISGNENDYIGTALHNEWYLVIDKTLKLWSQHHMELLSQNARLLCCTVIESINFSNVQEWADGRLLWSVENNTDLYPGKVLSHTGCPPTTFHDLKQAVENEYGEFSEESMEEDEEPNYVDIPAQLFCNTVGYKYYGEESLLPETEVPLSLV